MTAGAAVESEGTLGVSDSWGLRQQFNSLVFRGLHCGSSQPTRLCSCGVLLFSFWVDLVPGGGGSTRGAKTRLCIAAVRQTNPSTAQYKPMQRRAYILCRDAICGTLLVLPRSRTEFFDPSQPEQLICQLSLMGRARAKQTLHLLNWF